METTIYKRLNENAILSIDHYDNYMGERFHSLVIYYEDTEEVVQFGKYKVSNSIYYDFTVDSYSFNNNYIIGYKYDEETQWLKVDRIYDIKNRCDMLNKDKTSETLTCVNVQEDIKKNKFKELSLERKYRKIR